MKKWRCFHCDEVFTDPALATDHFGHNQTQEPICQVNAVKFREMEELVRRYQDEDTDLHRQIHRMQSDHQVALIREEEKGYAKGLQDGRAFYKHLSPDEASNIIQESWNQRGPDVMMFGLSVMRRTEETIFKEDQ